MEKEEDDEFDSTRPKLHTICTELVTVQYKWFRIGVLLKIPRHKLKEFEKEAEPFVAVVDYWLGGNVKNTSLTWKTIVKVLQDDYLDEKGLADTIKKYIQQEERASFSSQSETAMDRSLSPTYTDSPGSVRQTSKASFSSQSETAGDYVMSTAQSPSSPTYTDSPFAQTNWNDPEGERPCSPETVLRCVRRVKKVRAFGVTLKLDFETLDKDRPSDLITLIVTEWFTRKVSDRWEELRDALMAPAVSEPEIARSLDIPYRPPLRKGSSVDSAISVPSLSPGSPISFSFRPQYQPSYIDKIGGQDCSIQNVLNIIALYSEWYDIGLHLQLPPHDLEFIEKSYKPEEYHVRLVELWWRTHKLTWEKLRSALRELLRAQQPQKESTSSQVVSLSPLVFEHPPPPDQTEEPYYDQEEVESEVDKLEMEFQSIQQVMMDVLRNKGITQQKLRDAIGSFPPHVQQNAIEILPENIGITKSFSCLNLKFVWSFLDYHLLEKIVKTFGSEPEKQSMRDYLKSLKTFRKRTTISKLMDAWDGSHSQLQKYKECKELRQKLNWDPEQSTLDQLETIRRRTINVVPLSGVALVIYYAKRGCVSLVWLVSNEFVPHFKSAFARCIADGVYFKENNIISLELDGEVFRSMERQLFQVCLEGKVKDVDGVVGKWNKRKHNCNDINEDGKTAVIMASELGRASVVVSLLEADINVDIDYQTEDMKWSALFYAYNNGHWDTVRLLLEYGANSNLRDKNGMLPIEVAPKKPQQKGMWKRFLKGLETQAEKLRLSVPWKKKDLWHFSEAGDREAVERLLENEDIDINMQDHSHKNWTPLHYACRFGHFDVAKLLLDRGAIVDAIAERDWTPLAMACYYNYVRISNLLLKSGADPTHVVDEADAHFTPIMLVTSDCHEQEDMEPLARSLLKYPAARESLNTADCQRWTPIMNASNHKWVNLVQLYLEHGADPTQIADKGWTALMSAAMVDAGDIANLLIEKAKEKAKPGDADYMELQMVPGKRGGYNALHVASYKGSVEVVRELVKHGADPNVTNAAGLTPLSIATNKNYKSVVKELLMSKKINVNQPHEAGLLPPLFTAAKNGYLDIFELLLEHGAQVEINVGLIGETRSITVSNVASIFNKKEILTRLKKHQMSQQQQQEIRPQAIPPATLPVDMVEGTEVSSTATMPPKLLSDDSVAADQTDVEGAHAQVAEDVVTGPQPHAAEEQNLESKESAQMPDTVESTQVSQGVKEDLRRVEEDTQGKDESSQVSPVEETVRANPQQLSTPLTREEIVQWVKNNDREVEMFNRNLPRLLEACSKSRSVSVG